VFDLDEAVLSVSERLPEEVTSQLSYADVRDLVRWHMNDLRSQGLKPPAAVDEPQDPSKLVVVDEEASVGSLAARVASEGRTYSHEEIEAVVEAHLEYLREIGAIGPPAGDAQL
jgi:hypothetical protein